VAGVPYHATATGRRRGAAERWRGGAPKLGLGGGGLGLGFREAAAAWVDGGSRVRGSVFMGRPPGVLACVPGRHGEAARPGRT
jgi:hypothetical protein